MANNEEGKPSKSKKSPSPAQPISWEVSTFMLSKLGYIYIYIYCNENFEIIAYHCNNLMWIIFKSIAMTKILTYHSI